MIGMYAMQGPVMGIEVCPPFVNVKATLSRHGLGMQDIIKCTVFLADISEWPTFNEI
jgi:hypothetical protein